MSQCHKLLILLVQGLFNPGMFSIRTTTRATQRPKQVTVSLFSHGNECPVGKNDLQTENLVYGESMLAR